MNIEPVLVLWSGSYFWKDHLTYWKVMLSKISFKSIVTLWTRQDFESISANVKPTHKRRTAFYLFSIFPIQNFSNKCVLTGQTVGKINLLFEGFLFGFFSSLFFFFFSTLTLNSFHNFNVTGFLPSTKRFIQHFLSKLAIVVLTFQVKLAFIFFNHMRF